MLVWAGADAGARPDAAQVWSAFALALLAAGLLSALVAVIQVFAPAWADGVWIARSGLVGRAVGNLRQPNHLCTLLLWALVAAVSLHQLGQLRRTGLWLTALLLVFAVELSASRTGAVGLLLLPLWAWLDKRLSRDARWLLAAAPLLYGLAYGAMAAYGHYSQQAIGAAARIAAEAVGIDSPNSRLNIWRNTWDLVLQQPLAGVGFGEFNIAWTLTSFPGRPTAFFDHSHNLPLELLAELGVPLALLLMGLLGLALWLAWRRAAAAEGPAGVAARSALVVVLMIGWHSQVEYPLWYSYFLLPAALAWGFAMAVPVPVPAMASTDSAATDRRPAASAGSPPSLRAGAVAGLVVLMGGMAALLDYTSHAVVIYSLTDNAGSLAQRILRGQGSPLFAHHADYAAATNPVDPASTALGLARAPHNLLDTRLMIAWARQLHASGHTDLARTVAARVREFSRESAGPFFMPCTGGGQTEFQCQPPQHAHGWRDLSEAAWRAASTMPGEAPAGAATPAGQAPSATQ